MAAPPFVHLHVHTEYSLLDGAIRVRDLVARAAELGMPAVAVTDHGSLYGIIDFYQAAQKAGIKPLIGCEIYLARGSMFEKKSSAGRGDYSHLTLIAENNQGYANLMQLVSLAHLDGFYYKPRIDKENLARYSEGIIALSGCLQGEINQSIVGGQIDAARQSVAELRDLFGPQNFFLELHDHGLEAQKLCNRQLIKFSKEFDLPLVAANDVHFLHRADHEAHDVMICIGTGAHVHDEKRLHYTEEVYFKTPQEMAQLFPELPEALSNTVAIAERCNVTIDFETLKYPSYTPPEGKTREGYLHELCEEGLQRRYGERARSDPSLRERMNYELSVLERMGFVSYFLIVWDFIHFAKERDIPVGPGRGSAAGSLVAYVLGIVDLDPIRFGLIFERFLNPERVSPPDIDVDFCMSRRGEVIDYVREKYGERAVSHIITFGTMGAKSVVRDVGRVLGFSYGDADRIAKMIPAELGITLESARQKNPKLEEALQTEEATSQLWEKAVYLEGLTRNVGIHAAGVIIADRDLSEYVPLTRGQEGEVVTQYAMNPLTELGLLKMDFLGLKTLTVIQSAVDLIRQRAPDFSIHDISLEDAPTFKLLNAGETIGVFQLESGGMINLAKRFGVDRIDDIIALIALYRPGPMDLIPEYIERKKGQKKIRYEHPLLEEVCADTYGIMIYQEQVQKAANLLAGYSLGQADLLRRAMGKKDKEKMAAERMRFIEGCQEANQIGSRQANKIFDLLEKFAGYGFNKSHSAAYGLISYQTAYLKANYPVEFMAALLSNDINNTDKISVFVAECQRMGIEILPPDVNASQLDFAPDPNRPPEKPAIRYGLAAIKNVSGGAMEVAIAARLAEGPVNTLEDFALRHDSKVANRKNLEHLIKAGAFDFTKEPRAQLVQRLDRVLASSASAHRDRQSGQESLFDAMEFAATPAAAHHVVQVEEWPKEELLAFEKELLGFYVTGHPLDDFRDVLECGIYEPLVGRAELEAKKIHSFAGFLTEVDVKYTKKEGKPFAILTLEDLTGVSEVMAWNETYQKCEELLEKGKVVEVRARVDATQDPPRLTAREVLPFNPNKKARRKKKPPAVVEPPTPADNPQQKLEIFLQLGEHSSEDLQAIAACLRSHPGEIPVIMVITNGQRSAQLVAHHRFSVTRCAELEAQLSRWTLRWSVRPSEKMEALRA